MILDATAGNKTMWEHKNSGHIIYIDIEKKLERKPTIWASNKQTPFPDNSFDTIFYDPPHNWGGAKHYFSFPSKKERKEVFPDAGGIPTYYGWDKYKNKSQLIKGIYEAGKEFTRILKPDGLMWFKWNEMRTTLNRIIMAFTDWVVLMTLYVNDPTHTAGQHQTFWVCLQQKEGKQAQTPILDFL